MQTEPLLVHLWIAALRAARGFTIGTALREVETYPGIYRPLARA